MIEVKNITKRYGRKKVLNGVTFTARKREITCLIGVNGVGKTTILKAIMNLLPIDSGEILVNGERPDKHLYNKVSYIPDMLIVPPNLRIGEAMEFMADFYASWNQERADEILTFFRLNRDDRISELSKGNRAKVNLLLGLALDSDYVLMDEPFSGIDIFTREEIANVFTSHLVEDRGVLITTHEINDIEHLIDRAVILDEGVIIKQFDTELVREQEGKSVIDVMREVYNR